MENVILEICVYGRPLPGVLGLCEDIRRAFADDRGTLTTGLTLRSEIIGPLREAKLVAKLADRIIPGPNMVWVSSHQRDEILAILEPVFVKYQEILTGGIRNLRQVAETVGLGDWEQIVHMLVAGHLLDLGVGRHLVQQRIIRRQPSFCWLWVFEGTTLAYHKYGVRLWCRPNFKYAIGQLWYNKTHEPYLHFSEEDISAVSALGECDSNAKYAKSFLRLQYYHLIYKDATGYHQSIPVLRYANSDPLWVAIDDLSKCLVHEAIEPVVVPLRNLAQKLPRGQIDCFMHATSRLLLEHCMDRLVTNGVIPPFPKTPPSGFGFWFWYQDDAAYPFSSN